jgi:ADP-ribose pyrophosphatase
MSEVPDDAPVREVPVGRLPGFDGRFIHVRVDAVRLPSGRESAREVVVHPGSVAVLPITTGGDLLFVRQQRYAIGRPLTEIPAGLLDPGEDALTAAIRELREESGHAPGAIREITTHYPSAGYSDERQTIFIATGCMPLAGHVPDLDEGIALIRRSLADLPDLIAPGSEFLADAKTAIALLWLAANPGVLAD